VTRFFEDRRRSVGILCHPPGGAFSVLLSAVESGSCVALLIDRPGGRGGRASALFGRRVILPTGHAVLAARCRVPVLTAACVFAPGDRFKFLFGGPHYPDATLDEEACAADLHGRCRDDMERFIRAHPDQWFNFKRFGDDTHERGLPD
jgi:lauroyl/myristoyl acyltransferase